MKAIRIFIRSVSEAFKSIFRNVSLSIASISCISITLILVAVSLILSYNVNNFTTDIEKDVTVVVFLEKGITTDEINIVKEQIGLIGNIDTIEFDSKEKYRD